MKYEIEKSKQTLHVIDVEVGEIFCRVVGDTKHMYIKICDTVESSKNVFDITGNRLESLSCTDAIDSIYRGTVHFDKDDFITNHKNNLRGVRNNDEFFHSKKRNTV